MPRPSSGDELTADYLDRLTYFPVTQLEQQAAQTVANNTDTAVTYGTSSETFDDENWHDVTTNNTRITPNIEGRYYVHFHGTWAGIAEVITNTSSYIRKNGTTVISRSGGLKPATGASSSSLMIPSVETYVDMNGTTDYLETMVVQVNAGATSRDTNNASTGRCTFIVVLHRRT